MRYFQTDESGYLVGEFDADESPLEPGVFLIPGGGVETAPPAVGANQAAQFADGAWRVVPDLRGRVYWTADRVRHEITERGEALPAGALDAEPPKTPEEIAADEDRAARAELAALDLASIRAIREYIAAKPDAPQILKDREAAAVAARARLLPK